MKRKSLICAGIILIGLAAVWRFGISYHWTQRVPPGWSWKCNFVGISTYPDPQTGQFPTRDVTAFYQRLMHIASETGRPRAVLLEDSYVLRDLNTGQKTWEYIYRAEVDPVTGAHLKAEYLGDIYMFPRSVEKKIYRFRNNYLKGIPLSFQREEDVEGLRTYLFTYTGDAEYTECYAGTADWPGIKVDPGQEIKCSDDQFTFRAWVEPVTGEIVKLDEGCDSGDYVYEVSTGKPLAAVLRWAGVTAGDDVIERAGFIRRQRTKYLWASRYSLWILFSAGLVCIGFGLIPKKSKIPASGETRDGPQPSLPGENPFGATSVNQ
jgi:hypothetical protein